MSSEASHDPWLTTPASPKVLPEALLVSTKQTGPKPGDRLGSYELLALLGKGGMGLVFRARHVRLKKNFALKVLSLHFARDPDAIRRFERETEALGRLEHVHLVRASDAGVENETPFVVMELLEGMDLASVSRQLRRWPIAEACEAVRQAALGLQHAYERGLVHRDVKPSNLWLTPAGVVKVLDLGLARLSGDKGNASPLTAAGMWMGTPDYIAPEQILDSHTADTRADVYSLGCTLFHLLSDEPPFGPSTHPTLKHKSEAHLKETPPDIRQRRTDVPAELAAVLTRLLAKRPEERYQTPAEVAAALTPFARNTRLETLLSSQPFADARSTRSEAATPTDAEPGKSALEPNKVFAHGWYWGGAAVLLTASIGLGVLLSRHAGTQPQPLPSSQAQEETRAAEKLRVLRLDVKHFPTVQNRPEVAHVGLLGKTSFQSQPGDSVTVESQLSRPAYAFLIAFRPDGSDDVCFPEKDDEAPPLSDRPRYPSTSPGVHYRLSEGAGLQVFALVASPQPLPCYKQWRKQCSRPPWGKNDAPSGMVWRANGADDPLAFSDEDSTHQRGKGWEVLGKTPVAQLAGWLRRTPQAEAVAVLGFAVLPKDKR